MAISDEMMAAIQAATTRGEAPLLESQTGRTWQVSLQRALGMAVADRTVYRTDRAYCLEAEIPAQADRSWRSSLRVRLSGVGPYVTHVFVQSHNALQWWAGAFRTDRQGFGPEDAAVLAKLRTWMRDQGLQELDLETQGTLLPGQSTERTEESEPVSLFHVLFGSGLAPRG